MTLRAWLRLAALVLGALALSALVWWAGPLIAVADIRPLDAAWVRAVICALILTAVGAISSWSAIVAQRRW